MDYKRRKRLNDLHRDFPFLWAIRSSWDNVRVRIIRAPKSIKRIEEIFGLHEEGWIIIDSDTHGPAVIHVHRKESRTVAEINLGELLEPTTAFMKKTNSVVKYLVVSEWMIIDSQDGLLITVYRPPIGMSWEQLLEEALKDSIS